VRKAFTRPGEFTTSPLYRAVSRTVAASDELLDLAGQGRPGQYPTFLFFGAVHRLLLRGTKHPLADYYPSVAGARALPAGEAGPALEAFGHTYTAELPAGQARLVFHTATRLHVAQDHRPAFDAAIEAAGETGPLWWLSAEDRPSPDPRPHPVRDGAALLLRDPEGATRTLAVVDGHLRWVETLPTAAR